LKLIVGGPVNGHEATLGLHQYVAIAKQSFSNGIGADDRSSCAQQDDAEVHRGRETLIGVCRPGDVPDFSDCDRGDFVLSSVVRTGTAVQSISNLRESG
jgi:hypothetical protein